MSNKWDDIQTQAEQIGVPPFTDVGHIVGLCPYCKQPLALSHSRGGKLSPFRDPDVRHIFSGRCECEDATTNAKLSGMTGQQKSDFFAQRHDFEKFKDLSMDYRKEIWTKLWPGVPFPSEADFR